MNWYKRSIQQQTKSQVRKKGDSLLTPRYEGICTKVYEKKRDTVSKVTVHKFLYIAKPSEKVDCTNSVMLHSQPHIENL